MATLGALIESFETLWPLSGAEEWDAPGLVCGNPNQTVSKVLLTVDVTAAVVAEAIDGGFDLILAHHPYLMRGVKTLAEDTVKGQVISRAIRAGVAIYSAHTNADIVESGVSAALAAAVGIEAPVALDTHDVVGSGRFGMLPEPETLGEFALRLAKILPSTATGIRVSGDYNRLVERVAVCGGAGDSFISLPSVRASDVYVTSDLRHHVAQDAAELAALGSGPALIDISHWAGEFLWLGVAAAQLRKIHSGVTFEVCELRTDPWDFVITQ